MSDEKLREIAQAVFPRGISRPSLLRVGAFDRVDAAHDRVVAHRGDAPQWVFVVLRGQVDAVASTGHRTPHRVGELVGDAPALAHQSWPHTSVVHGSARLLLIPTNRFANLLAEVPELGAVVLRSLSARVVAAETPSSRRNHARLALNQI